MFNIGPSGDIRMALQGVRNNDVTCTSSDIGTNIGIGNYVSGRSVTINPPDKPFPSYTFSLTCTDSASGTSDSATITLRVNISAPLLIRDPNGIH